MLYALRIALPDRPGSLARISRVVANSGGDIARVDVLEQQSGRAIDDFLVEVPHSGEARLREALEREPGLSVLSFGPSTAGPGCHPELDLLEHVVSRPERAFVTITDMAPPVFAAEWAVTVLVGPDDTTVLHRSPGAPSLSVEALPLGRAVRLSVATQTPGGAGLTDVPAVAVSLTPDTVLVVGRTSPEFHTLEVNRLRRVAELVAAVAARAVAAEPAPSVSLPVA